jgi:hypothetical protein
LRGADMRLLRLTPEAARTAPSLPPAESVTEKDNLVFRLGMYGTALTPAMAQSMGGVRGGPGVLVLALAGLGLTGQSAIGPGDIVHTVNGTAVDTVEALRSALDAVPDGGAVVLQIERAGMLSYVIPGALSGGEQRLKKTSLAAGQRTEKRQAIRY